MSTPLPVCKYRIEYRTLKALALLASRDPSRPAINGVAIEAKGNEIFTVSTDGRRLGVIRSQVSKEAANA